MGFKHGAGVIIQPSDDLRFVRDVIRDSQYLEHPEQLNHLCGLTPKLPVFQQLAQRFKVVGCQALSQRLFVPYVRGELIDPINQVQHGSLLLGINPNPAQLTVH